MSIRSKLIVFAFLCSILPLVVVFAMSYQQKRESLMDAAESVLVSETSQILDGLHTSLMEARRSLDNFSKLGVTEQIENYDSFGHLQDDLDVFIRNNPVMKQMAAINLEGVPIADTGKQWSRRYNDIEAFKLGVQGKLHTMAPVNPEDSENLESKQGLPIVNRSTGKVVGVLLGKFDWAFLNAKLNWMDVFGGRQDEQRLISFRMANTDMPLYQTNGIDIPAESDSEATLGTPVNIMIDGKSYVSVTMKPRQPAPYWIPGLRLQILVDNDVVYENVSKMSSTYAFIALGILALVSILALFLARTFSSRISVLVEGAEKITSGDLDCQLPPSKNTDELGKLYNGFEAMRQTIKSNESALVEKSRLAEEGARLKGEFLANMSHEIRTPINGVLGMTELMLQTELNKSQKRYASTILRSGQSLLSVINDILDFSKIEAGKLELHYGPFDLREVVEDVVDMLAEPAHRKGLELTLDLAPESHLAYNGDSNRIRQILVNLINNAIKFTSNGGVHVNVQSITTDTEDAPKLQFSVTDTGIGIAENKLDQVFESFAQADGTTTREFGGTGLGLTISRKLVDLMGGEIWVNSKLGEGSVFSFTASVDRLPESVQKRWSRPDALSDRCALVVDDNETNREILQAQLQHWGVEVIMASSAAEATERYAEALAINKAIDVAVVDQQMPQKTGIDFIESIRQTYPESSTKFVVLSSVNDQSDVAIARALSVHTHVTKPVRQQDLFNCLAAAVGEAEFQDQYGDDNSISKLKFSGHVLLVEDNPVNQDMMLEMLRLMGLTTDLAENGQESLDRLAEKSYDLVLMDCQMPVMDGFVATAQIRKRESEKADDYAQPIVALTANALQGDRQRCLDAGMSDYLSKPVSSADLRRCFSQWLNIDDKTNSAVVETATANPNMAIADVQNNSMPDATVEQDTSPAADSNIVPINGNKPEPSSPEFLDDMPVLDEAVFNDVIKICQNASAGFFASLFNKYQVGAENDINNLKTAIEEGDAAKVMASAHRLKSSSANWGGVRVRAVCQLLENHGKEETLAEAPALLEVLEAEVAALSNQLAARQENAA